MLPGSYTITVTDITGCEISSTINIIESNEVTIQVNGGNEGFQESILLPAGMKIQWKFNPMTVTDQFILKGQNIIADTGPITNGTSTYCTNNQYCSCSSVFMGDYDNGDLIPIATGSAYKSYPYIIGDAIVPQEGQLDLMVIGAICGGGTGWNLKLGCIPPTQNIFNYNDDIDLSYVQYPHEVEGLISSGKISKAQFLKDSLNFHKLLQKDYKILEIKGKNRIATRSMSGNNSTILDFRCSGFEASPYKIKMVNKETGEFYYCDIIDNVSCPKCTEETDGCK